MILPAILLRYCSTFSTVRHETEMKHEEQSKVLSMQRPLRYDAGDYKIDLVSLIKQALDQLGLKRY